MELDKSSRPSARYTHLTANKSITIYKDLALRACTALYTVFKVWFVWPAYYY